MEVRSKQPLGAGGDTEIRSSGLQGASLPHPHRSPTVQGTPS